MRKIKARDELGLAKINVGQVKGPSDLYLEQGREQERCRNNGRGGWRSTDR